MISLSPKSKRKKPDEAGLHTRPGLPCLYGSNLFQLDMAAECVASAPTHTSRAARPAKRSDAMHSDLTHAGTGMKKHPPNCPYVKTHARSQQTEIQTIRPTHQLFTSVRSNENNTSQFEKSICERNLKLWNSIWSLCLCLHQLRRRCSVA